VEPDPRSVWIQLVPSLRSATCNLSAHWLPCRALHVCCHCGMAAMPCCGSVLQCPRYRTFKCKDEEDVFVIDVELSYAAHGLLPVIQEQGSLEHPEGHHRPCKVFQRTCS
jgi:hypothetical protein